MESIVQFSSVTQSCLTLCNPMDCSLPGFPVHYQLPELAQTHSCPLSRCYHPTISSSVVPFSSYLPSFPASGSFPMSQFFTSGGQSTGISMEATQVKSVHPNLFPHNLQNIRTRAFLTHLILLLHITIQIGPTTPSSKNTSRACLEFRK